MPNIRWLQLLVLVCCFVIYGILDCLDRRRREEVHCFLKYCLINKQTVNRLIKKLIGR